jgi:nitrate reductase NapE component
MAGDLTVGSLLPLNHMKTPLRLRTPVPILDYDLDELYGSYVSQSMHGRTKGHLLLTISPFTTLTRSFVGSYGFVMFRLAMSAKTSSLLPYLVDAQFVSLASQASNPPADSRPSVCFMLLPYHVRTRFLRFLSLRRSFDGNFLLTVWRCRKCGRCVRCAFRGGKFLGVHSSPRFPSVCFVLRLEIFRPLPIMQYAKYCFHQQARGSLRHHKADTPCNQCRYQTCLFMRCALNAGVLFFSHFSVSKSLR